MVTFEFEGVELPDIDYKKVSAWLTQVAADHDRIIGTLAYRFCTEEEILRINREFIGHDYYTDIITFENTIGRKVAADIFISPETVHTNAEDIGEPYDRELLRVIVHGLLHLFGIKDKTPDERREMEAAEDRALLLYKKL